MKKQLHQFILDALASTYPSEKESIQGLPDFQIESTKDPKHGDYACNVALIYAKTLRVAPRELAHKIVAWMQDQDNILAGIDKIDIAGPGFINFTCSLQARYQVIQDIFEQTKAFGKSTVGKGQKILLEYISSNPTGPLHVGHGRSAAFGSSLAMLLREAGYHVDCEYYINDAGRQMEILAVSVWLRYLNFSPFPTNSYQGDYVKEIANSLQQAFGDEYKVIFSVQDLPLDENSLDANQSGDKEIYIDAVIARAKEVLSPEKFEAIQAFATKAILSDIKEDLSAFGVHFEQWFSEKSLFTEGALEKSVIDLKKSGFTEEREGALWFQSTHFGDDKDRVVIRANGRPTYFASDVAYHWNKYHRGYEKLINIFGADHHGYIARLKAVVSALGKDPDALEILTVQFAILYRGEERVSMSTRSGSFVTLRELREEVGNDAARFFYIQRKSDQHMDFDLELAKSQSNDNPVYYVQYAHARICSVFRQLIEKGDSFNETLGLDSLSHLTTDIELNLMKQLSVYPDLIESAARTCEPHQITHYLRDLAQHFHAYYNSCIFLVDEAPLRQARLCLIMATKQVLQNGLSILGVSAPETM